MGVGIGMIKTHRAAWIIANGNIPAGLSVLHKCDNPPCCNPDHLFLGDHQINADDMVAKGRSARGEKSHHAKLKPTTVKAIRRALSKGATAAELAERYGVAAQSIDGIADGQYWAWLTDGDGLKEKIAACRVRRGDKHPRSVLTEQNVRDIRALGKTSMPRKQIAQQFNISLGGLESILYGYSWKWLK